MRSLHLVLPPILAACTCLGPCQTSVATLSGLDGAVGTPAQPQPPQTAGQPEARQPNILII
ncbi:MAG: hypothetical protein QGI93_03400, partial [Planctomycetota bacterium]|nr:hypothetical protein [Planctomycetota bacterium]